MRTGIFHSAFWATALAFVLPAIAQTPLLPSPTSTPGSPDAFAGFIVPANATDVMAPNGAFRLRGWTWWGSWVKIVELKEDGAKVKTGEIIARFEFPGHNALERIDTNLRQVEADRIQSNLLGDETLENLSIAHRRKQLEARLAKLDTERERALSKKQASIFRIGKEIADFEVEATEKQLEAKTKAVAAEREYCTLAVARAKTDLYRYHTVEQQFEVHAPHDGVIRHAFSPRERRKYQKGDPVGCGMKVISVAKDTSLAVKFMVPEHRVTEVKEGAEIIVTTPLSAKEYRAVISHIDFFPQEMGFLLEVEDLPGSRDHAVAVLATLRDTTGELTAGTEAQVKVKTP